MEFAVKSGSALYEPNVAKLVELIETGEVFELRRSEPEILNTLLAEKRMLSSLCK
jgi:hypothetical protein